MRYAGVTPNLPEATCNHQAITGYRFIRGKFTGDGTHTHLLHPRSGGIPPLQTCMYKAKQEVETHNTNGTVFNVPLRCGKVDDNPSSVTSSMGFDRMKSSPPSPQLDFPPILQ